MAPAPRRRRSRNRGRHRPISETGAPATNAATAEKVTAQRGVEQESPGHTRGGRTDAKRPEPATYGQLEAAFFDLDKTVIAKASMVAFGRPFYHGGLINRRTALRALYGELVYLHLGASEQKLNRIRESVLRLIKGWHRDRVCEIVAEAIEAIVEPIIFAEAADLIDWHHEQGRLVVIVSASPDEIVTPLSRFLGADECIASKAAWTTTAVTQARCSFTPSGRSRPRRWTPSLPNGASTSPLRTPTPTPIQTCPCWRRWAIPLPSTRTAC